MVDITDLPSNHPISIAWGRFMNKKYYEEKGMKATEHMLNTAKFAIYPKANTGDIQELMYIALGLSDEAGEVAGKIKKLYRDGTFDKEAIAKELGDVYWYLHRMCAALELQPEEVMYMNWEKLSSRQERGVLGGSGDNR